MKKILGFVLILTAVASAGFSQAVAAEKVVVAATSWTAAFVRAAGFTGQLHTLAPASFQHPPEYELKPSDIRIIASADIIVFAGYERMAVQLKDAVAKKNAILIQITTDYSLNTIKDSLNRLAAVFGTGAAAESSITMLTGYFSSLKSDLALKGAAGKDIICHALQVPFLRELGFSVRAVYGPAPLEPSQLKTLSGFNPLFIVDNWHNQIAKPLKDLYPKTPIAVFINFPGQDGTVSLMDVLQYNRKELFKALGM